MTEITKTLWVEKHRPETLDDIIGHEHIVKRLESYVGDAEMPHLLFYGQQGVGKTAMATALAKEIFGDSWRNNFMELNASADRGIDVIRDNIKERAVEGPTDTNQDFQIIFLDEVDALTDAAQNAFRRTMEQNSDITRFILSCNYPNQIIDPILSRCARFRVTPLDDGSMREVLQQVVDAEGVEVGDGAVDAIIDQAGGDARRAIMDLQMCQYQGEITVDDVETLVGVVDQELLGEIVDLALGGEIHDAMERLDQDVLKQGIEGEMLLEAFLDLAKDREMPQYAKIRVIDKIGELDRALRHGANPHVQFHSLLMNFQAAHHLPPLSGEREEIPHGE